jgi:hypothetical protein
LSESFICLLAFVMGRGSNLRIGSDTWRRQDSSMNLHRLGDLYS